MDDPGTLIYIAFAAISLLAGWYKNKKKKQEAAKPAAERSIQNERERNRGPVEVIFDTEPMNYEAKPADKRERWHEKKSPPIESSFEQETPVYESSPLALLDEEFDAKKAFIYSEILKRPSL